MIRYTFFALVAWLAAASAQAAITITTMSQATVGMAGFTTYTLTATSDHNPIAGFDFFGTGRCSVPSNAAWALRSLA